MADLMVFLVLVGVVAAVGIVLGMLVARRLGAWDERRAGTAAGDGDDMLSGRGTGSTRDAEPLEDGGEIRD